MPKWFVIEEEPENKVEGESSGGGGARLSRSLTVGSKYAKAKPAARSNGHADGESSEECTDDEVYLTRHKPFEEQEFRFRYHTFNLHISVACMLRLACTRVFRVLNLVLCPVAMIKNVSQSLFV